RQPRGFSPEGEDRVALDLLDLERRREVADHLVEQGRDDLGAVLELGGGHEGGESGHVGQDQVTAIGPAVHAAPPVRPLAATISRTCTPLGSSIRNSGSRSRWWIRRGSEPANRDIASTLSQ